MKREARIARVEPLPKGAALIIVLRGAWIDGLLSVQEGERVATRLQESRYSEELRGISIGDGLAVEEAAALREWAKSKGLPEVRLGARNRRQAEALAGGFRQLLEPKA